MKEEQDERLFKERTFYSMRNKTIKEKPVQPAGIELSVHLKKPQIRQRNDLVTDFRHYLHVYM